jgi:hypothetical protein
MWLSPPITANTGTWAARDGSTGNWAARDGSTAELHFLIDQLAEALAATA